MKKWNDPAADGPRAGGTSTVNTTVGWHGVEVQAPLHVITLVSSTAPLPLQAPKAPELAGLAVFRSRRVEDGRERFRLHIGYFASAADAEAVLPVVRTIYPAAFVSPAPQSNLGSLEDTGIARFSILRPIDAAPESAQSPEPSQAAMAPLPPAPPELQAAAAVALPPELAPQPAPPVAEPAPEAKPAQRYAVQLVWSKDAIDLGRIPNLAIFGGYLLYAVETEPGGRRMYGVRLGFYADALSARLVAQYVRSEFRGVAVVPVSEREVSRASSAAIRLSASRSARGVSGTRVRWPQAAVTVAFSPTAPTASPVSL
jgi:cell division septation protein DedD